MKGIGHRVRQAREAAGLSQVQLAELVGIKQQTIDNLERGKAAGSKHVVDFARVLNQDAEWLQNGKGQMRTGKAAPRPREILPVLEPANGFAPVPVLGAVQAGVWREALQWESDEIYPVTVPIPPAFAGYRVFGLEVRGPSMNELYPHKSVVFCVNMIELGRDARNGERVVIYRRSKDGLMEATLKEYWVDDKGVGWLRPRSNHADFQKAWRATDTKDGYEVEVHALVIGSWRPEV